MPQIDDPTRADASLLDRIKRLEDQQSAVPLGKTVFATGWANAIAPVITPTPSVLSTTIQVPKFATSCGYSVFAAGGGLNTTGAAGFLTVKVEVIYGSYDAWTFQSQSNIASGNTGNVTVPMVDTFNFPPGGGTLTLLASIYNGAGSWTNVANNSIFPEGLFVFQY